MFVRTLLISLLFMIFSLKADIQYNYENALKLYQQQQLDSANIYLRNVLKHQPDNLSAQILLGQILLEQQRFAQALNVFEGALSDGADLNLISDELSFLYLLHQDEYQLLKLAKQGTLSTSKRFNWLLVSANLLQDNGKLVEAEQQLNHAEQLYPKHLSLLNAKAGLAIKQGKLDVADALLQQVLTAEPNNIEALLSKGNLARKQQQFDVALRFNQHAFSVAPDNPFVLRALSAAYFAVGRPEQAKPLLLQLQNLGLNDAYLRFAMLTLSAVFDDKSEHSNLLVLRDEMKSLSIEYFEAAPSQLYLRAALNYLLGAHEQAIEDLEAYLNLNPRDLNAIALIAEHYIKTREPSMVLRFLERHQEQIKDSVPLMTQYILLTNRVGKPKAAESLLATLRSRYPTDDDLVALDTEIKRQLYGPEYALKSLEQRDAESSDITLMTHALLALDLGKTELATEKAKQLVARDEKNPEYLNLYAGILLHNQQYQLANQTLSLLLQVKPEHFAGRLTLANLLLAQGKYSEAQDVLNQLLVEQPQHQATAVLLAAAEFKSDKSQQAEQRLNALLNTKIYRPAVDLLLSHYRANKSYQDAYYLLQRVLRQDSLNKGMLLQEIDVLIALNQPVKANEKLSLVISLPDLDSANLLQIGKFQYQLGQKAKALLSLQQAADKSPQQLVYQYEYIEMLIAENELARANQQLATLKKRAGELADYSLLLANYLKQQGKNNDAFNALERSITADPSFLRAWSELYELARDDGLKHRFASLVQQHLSTMQNNFWLKRLLAEHFINHQQFDLARQQYEDLLGAEQFTTDPWLYNNLANTLLETEPTQALLYANQADTLVSNNSTFKQTKAKALLKLAQFDQALSALRQAYAIDSVNPQVNYLLSDTLQKLGRKDEARQVLQSFSDNSADKTAKRKAKQLLDEIK